MGVLREMFPAHFTKKAKKEREMRAKIPQEPKMPQAPLLPTQPEKVIKKKYHTLHLESFSEDSHVTIPYDKIIEARKQINIPDDEISFNIQSLTSGSEEYTGSYVDSVYFSWYDTTENEYYDEHMAEYNRKMEAYKIKYDEYEKAMKQYRKDKREYKKKMEAYRLEQMKEQKVNLEAQIAKLEKQ